MEAILLSSHLEAEIIKDHKSWVLEAMAIQLPKCIHPAVTAATTCSPVWVTSSKLSKTAILRSTVLVVTREILRSTVLVETKVETTMIEDFPATPMIPKQATTSTASLAMILIRSRMTLTSWAHYGVPWTASLVETSSCRTLCLVLTLLHMLNRVRWTLMIVMTLIIVVNSIGDSKT